ncbi:phosphate ABC transporter, inner membrane subunit PstC [Thermodesulfobacterium geofontis OPF15]|uniref:Phosphate transport system permease protein n=1 Tax=Thermodesulfobacterium geofontis (strain OPF15) TaxID=795359 RepID=F8C4C6_THEGP|nr:phosphate ABC transporter permease subunit PstC [Thermodesulfobacterium geofontis]AEH22628.1 phosphate ABC transporter, inner membrane subunit PstC [Thermodesulfobacterium geofontis OPF15]
MIKRNYYLEIIIKNFLGFWAIFSGFLFPFTVFLILFHESLLAIKTFGIVKFLTTTTWDPVSETFGGLTMITGTLISTFIAVIIAAPIAIGIAIFITELAPSFLKGIVTSAIQLLAAIPSIIYGMWGFLVLASFMRTYIEPTLQKLFSSLPLLGKLFSGPPTGIDVLTTSLVLSIMIIPFMASVVKDSFDLVPSVMKESAYSLGATKWEVIKDVVIPYTASGITGGLILSTGRALGETMAVTFLAGNVTQIPTSLFSPFTTITVALANQFTEADTPLYLSALFYLSFILFILSFVILSLAKLMVLRLEKKWK